MSYEQYYPDNRDFWTAVHHRRRLKLAAGLNPERRLEWARRLKEKAMRQRPYRVHLICMSAVWEGNLLQGVGEQDSAIKGECDVCVV